MFYEQMTDQQYAIRLVRGEDVFTALAHLCEQQNIRGAFFNGIGALDKAELAHYSIPNQKYSTKSFTQPLEVVNLTGNIAYHQDDIVIHAHGTFSDEHMNCVGGHVVSLIVSSTLELILTETKPLTKQVDPETGLKLLDLGNQLKV